MAQRLESEEFSNLIKIDNFASNPHWQEILALFFAYPHVKPTSKGKKEFVLVGEFSTVLLKISHDEDSSTLYISAVQKGRDPDSLSHNTVTCMIVSKDSITFYAKDLYVVKISASGMLIE